MLFNILTYTGIANKLFGSNDIQRLYIYSVKIERNGMAYTLVNNDNNKDIVFKDATIEC